MSSGCLLLAAASLLVVVCRAGGGAETTPGTNRHRDQQQQRQSVLLGANDGAGVGRTTIATSTVGLVHNASRSCKVSEHRCTSTGACIAQDKFCDGENDCQEEGKFCTPGAEDECDKSDEPEYCTPCNRTLYGDVGRTYELQIRRPREERLPFLCHLNFTAAGQEFGDLVQLTFDTFTVGRFQSYTSDGCPDGYMSISEEGRPPTGGQWCGSAWGYTVYYSETRSINLTLYLSWLPGQGNNYNFDFKLSYKFLKRSEAHLRYGNSSMSTWRGELVNATYCDRVFTRCDQRACRLQSPNYPGVYPRNVTCYYRIEQKRAPPGHRALLAVSQRNSHKIHIKDQVNKYDTSRRTLRVWDQCNVVQDYLTVYDGGSTSDRVLVRLCGGDAVPDVVGSRDTMLLEFHTSPYDNPFHPVPLSFLPGFELEVQVIFVDERSTASFVMKNNDKCDFYISSYESSSGMLENPKHSLPPNTTCRYHFQGKPNEIVWLAFVKYYAATTDPTSSLAAVPGDAVPGTECNVKLLIWNGERIGDERGRHATASSRIFKGDAAHPGTTGSSDAASGVRENATLMGEFCKDEVPRLCDHSLLRNGSRHTRPCSMAESYVSTGRHLTLEHVLRQGSALYPVSFVVRYEFVHEASSCNRVLSAGGSASEFQSFGSPRSVFFYGRGGAANLSCVYRFEVGPDRRLELAITRASFGGRSCKSRIDPLVNRWSCERPTGNNRRTEGTAELRLAEYPWQGVQLPRDCLCSNLSERMVFQSLSSAVLELSFVVTRMNVTQDYLDFFFEGEYRFVPVASATTPALAVPGEALGATNLGQQHHNQHHNQQQQQHTSAGAVAAAAAAAAGAQACHGSSHSLSDSSRLSRLEERRLRGTSGEISLRSPPLTPASSGPLRNTVSGSSLLDSEGVLRNRLGGLATVDESLGPVLMGAPSQEPSQQQRSGGASAAEVTHCVNEPWLIEPEDSRLHFLYLKTPGFRLTRHNLDECPTRNRIIVYPAANTRDRTVVCPAKGNGTARRSGGQRIVDLISGGWNRTSDVVAAAGDRPPQSHQQQQQHSRSFVVEFLQQEPGYYVVTWMAISKRLLAGPADDNFFEGALAPSNVECPYRCPELNACISSVLWCDGVHHCPSGFDEREENCSYRFGVTLLYVAIGAGALGIFLILLLATGCLKYCLYRRRRLQRRHLQKKLPPQADEQTRLQKKKVQVLSVNHLNSPTNHSSVNRNNGNLDSSVHQQQQMNQQQQQQPRYANSTFARIGRHDGNSMLGTWHRQQQLHLHHQQPPQIIDDLDDEEDEFADKYSKDSIC
ncbi:uncharacterized protein LOC106639496 [Copidosoma floridanum]|uniref:uncharacterized protein LOC106639496 n=1 Tax=Copidosoma floridanum TaxID=29053 RepID=UPI000C6F506C|nr:uncharacterized protein LOC106639496 [Copidosoma floridanum]